MNRVEHFEDLRIWQDARFLVQVVYKDMKGNRDWGFRDQLQRAALSIMNNIAEGFERNSDSEFAHFLSIARGSAGEVRSMYYAASDLDYVDDNAAVDRRNIVLGISKGIGKLEGYLRK